MDAPMIVVKPGEGRSVRLGAWGVEFKVSGADTGGDFAVVQYPIAPGRLVLAADARTPAPARLLEMIAPAGFETYFVELAEAGDPGRRRELAAIRGDLSIELACRADSQVQPEVYLVNDRKMLSLYLTAVTPLPGWDRPLDAAVTGGFARDPLPLM